MRNEDGDARSAQLTNHHAASDHRQGECLPGARVLQVVPRLGNQSALAVAAAAGLFDNRAGDDCDLAIEFAHTGLPVAKRPVIRGRSKGVTIPGAASQTAGMALITRIAVMR